MQVQRYAWRAWHYQLQEYVYDQRLEQTYLTTTNEREETTTYHLKKTSHNTLDWVEKQLRDVVAFDIGISLESNKIL